MKISIRKFYDILLGEGPGGGNLYTRILSTSQKHRFAMMGSVYEVKAELKKLHSSTPSDTRYVQEESDIKQYLKNKNNFWMILQSVTIFVLLALVVLIIFQDILSVTVSKQQVVFICVLFISILYVAYANTTKYTKQQKIMREL